MLAGATNTAERLLVDPALARTMGAAARATAIREFAPEGFERRFRAAMARAQKKYRRRARKGDGG